MRYFAKIVFCLPSSMGGGLRGGGGGSISGNAQGSRGGPHLILILNVLMNISKKNNSMCTDILAKNVCLATELNRMCKAISAMHGVTQGRQTSTSFFSFEFREMPKIYQSPEIDYKGF